MGHKPWHTEAKKAGRCQPILGEDVSIRFVDTAVNRGGRSQDRRSKSNGSQLTQLGAVQIACAQREQDRCDGCILTDPANRVRHPDEFDIANGFSAAQ